MIRETLVHVITMWLKENWFKFGVFLVVAILGGSMAYYYAIVMPQKIAADQKQQLETIQFNQAIKQQSVSSTINNESQLTACMAKAQSDFVAAANTYCLSAGYTAGQIANNECTVPESVVKSIQSDKDSAVSLCLKLYK